MSRLEKKLEELGYELHPDNSSLYYKTVHNYIDIHIYVQENEITNYGVKRTFLINYIKEVKFIKEALRIMWNDLEVLKNVESER